MTQKELNEILKAHKEWVETNGLKGVRANLSDANLSYADLSRADLSRANLSDADLSDANLSRADLRFCIGNNKEVKSLQIGVYLINYYKVDGSIILNIGCQTHKLEEWGKFSDDEINKMDDENALDWWKKNKEVLFKIIELNPPV